MDTNPLYLLEQEDRRLAKGKEVIVNWCSNGFSYQGRAKVARLSEKTVTAELLEPVGNHGEYQAGHRLQLPRYCDFTRWSSSNCVRTAPSATFIHKDFL